MVRARQPTIERAITLVEEEIDLLEDEAGAFEGFLSRLREVGTSGPEAMAGARDGPATMAAVESVQSEGLRAVREAYRETVMAVPHYEEEYADTFRESVATELGGTLAGHLADGEVLTPAVYDVLVEASEVARDNRHEFLRSLRRERESLQEIAAELNDVESRLVELEDRVRAASTSAQLACVDEDLAVLERRCRDLANRRQSTLHNRSVRKLSGVDDGSLVRYLYADMETDTPALSDVATVLVAIQCQRERCLR